MHELLLYGQVPSARHDQVLKILAGVAAMQPQPVLERRIVYKPTRQPEEPGAHLSRRGGTQNVVAKPAGRKAGDKIVVKDLFYCQLAQKLVKADFGHGEGLVHVEGASLSAHVEAGEEPRWSFEFQDTPDTGDRGVSIRMTTSTDLLSGDPHAWIVASGPHQYVSEYYMEGHYYVHGNVIISLHRVLQEPGVRSLETAPKVELPAFSALKPLDPSGAYVLEAKVRVQDFGNTIVLEAAIRELKAFQTQMEGCVELVLPDRLGLDTRVKYKPPQAHAQREPR